MSTLRPADLEALHRLCTAHRALVKSGAVCGCFHCLAFFPPDAIEHWVDGLPGDADPRKGTTALCPRCHIDAVLPDRLPGATLTAEVLEAMRQYWFERSAG